MSPFLSQGRAVINRRKLLETALLAFHLSALLVWPVVHALGIPSMYQPGVYERYRLTKLFSDFRWVELTVSRAPAES